MQYPTDGFDSFDAFFPYYLSEHADPRNRALHYVGTSCALAAVVFAVATTTWWLLLVAPLCGYGAAWVGHFLIEHNRPATFKHPLWSLRGDFRMARLFLTGKLDDELARLEIG